MEAHYSSYVTNDINAILQDTEQKMKWQSQTDNMVENA